MGFRVVFTSPLKTTPVLRPHTIAATTDPKATRTSKPAPATTNLFERTGLKAAQGLDETALARSLHANALGSRARSLVHLLNAGHSPELQRLMATQPQLAAALVGVRIDTHLALPPGTVAEDLQVLVKRMEVLTRQSILVTAEPSGVRIWNHSAVLAATTPLYGLEAIGTMASDDEMSQETESVGRSPDVTLRVQEHDAAVALSTALVHSWVQNPASIPAPVLTAARVGKLSMLTQVTSTPALEELKQTLLAWQKNIAEFGHQNVTITLSDDSPAAYQGDVKALAEQLSVKGQVQFRVVSSPEKDTLRRGLKQHLAASSTAQTLRDTQAIGARDIEMMVDGLFGSSVDGTITSGPTENRNVAMFVNRGARSFNLDDDIVPSIYRKAWAQERSPSTTAAPSFEQLPIDLLQHLESAGQRAFSPALSGESDKAIQSIISQAPSGSSESLERYHDSGDGKPGRPLTYDGETTMSSYATISPQYTPPVGATNIRLLPWAPAIRDGDLFIGQMAGAVSMAPTPFRSALTQTRAAGAQANFDGLTYDTMTSSIVSSYLTGAIGALPQTKPIDVSLMGRTLLDNLAHAPDALQPQCRAQLTHWAENTKQVLARTDASLSILSDLVQRLESSNSDQTIDAYAEWVFGQTPQSLGAEPRAAIVSAEQREAAEVDLASPAATSKLADAISGVKAGIAMMEARKADVEGSRLGQALISPDMANALMSELQVIARQKARDYLLSMALAKELLDFRATAPSESVDWSAL
jgi:hypothetical protein